MRQIVTPLRGRGLPQQKASVKTYLVPGKMEEEHLEIPRKTKTYLQGPMDYAKMPKLQFRVGDLGPRERRKSYTSSREEEEEDGTKVPLC